MGYVGTSNHRETHSKAPSSQSIFEGQEAEQKGPVEVVPEEDGGATIDFEPGAINIPGTENHFDNLADILPEENLEPIGNEMVQNYMDYKSSRKDILDNNITHWNYMGMLFHYIAIRNMG